MDFKSGEDVLALKAVVQDIADPTSDGELPEEADEYARDTGLTVDSRKWPTAINHDMLMASTLAPTRPGRLLELPHLPECTFRSIMPLPEQLSIPKTAIEFGDQLIKACDEADIADLMNELSYSATSDTKFLKLEEPVLRSNPQADQRALASKLAAFRKTPLPNHRLPLHPVNIDDDEGLEFPPSARRGHKSLMDTMKKQRYDAKFSMVSYIHKTNEASWSDDEQRQVFDTVATYNGLADQGYVTPLSPRIESHTEPADYFVPDPEICLVPDPSPVCSKLETDIKAAGKRIFKADTDFWESLLSGETYSLKSCGFEYDDLDISGMIRAGEIPLPDHVYNCAPKAEALKLKIPLLPDDKMVDAAREPQRIIKPEDLEQAKELIKSEDDPPMADQKFSDFLQSKSDKMMRSAEQEKLSSIDSTARVPVPVMDFSAPKPDWIQDGCDTPAKMFTWTKRYTGHIINWNPVRWPSNRAAEQQMIWSPIAHIWDTKKLVSEKIEVDDELLRQFMVMTLDRDVMSSTDCVVKRHGLAILRDYDLDDELLDEEDVLERKTGLSTIPIPSHGTIRLRDSVSPSYNMPFLAGSWKQDLKNPPQEITLAKKRARRDSDEEPAPPKFARQTAGVIPSRDSQAAEMAMMDSASALLRLVDDKQWDDHSTLVENYAKRFKKSKVNSRFFGPSQDAIQDDDDLQSQARRKKEDDDAKAMPPSPKPIPALAPSFTLPNTAAPPKIIVASSVSHMLILELRNLIPGLGVITRDYGKWARSSSDLATATMEADIKLSPATGIMLTTMVKLRQKSLPGTPGSDFRSQVENVASKYETLLVLISEGNKHSESITPLNGSDANALVEFHGFVAGLSCQISVMYIGGGQETLAKWVASSISQHANEGAPVQDPLLEEETCWEVFLRRAGMNSFGAQAVLGLLKNPEADEEEVQTATVGATAGRLYGLPLFVMMSAEERIVMFEDIFGGRKVLEWVSEVLDWEWGVRSRGVNGLDGMVSLQAEERSWAWGGLQNRI
ncbi:hypothetical protein QBC37DRAFT_387988 [Rhypophila decipiens]|uniref:Uncharacterized protein n=1 Tax=Rhypophila decipiens TaxID=261697 RepID=A0AAN6Y6D2_9PEZI|nr:hypothetical protein QBC37DRAFT_387988 [Rhypophila decipiens]